MKVARTFTEARDLATGHVGLVPTMGFLHEGHLSHVAAARQAGDTVTMSLFVNPTQFAPGEDFARYPRDLDRDAALAEEAGVDVLFAPEVEEVYPPGAVTVVTVPGMADRLDGAHRPGHFDGVATVVTTLLAGIQPHRAYFGRKDAQQLAVIRRLVADLAIPVEIVGGATIRDADGLALSSRNVYLSATDRVAALSLSRGLMRAADAADSCERSAAVLERLVRSELDGAGIAPDYVELVSVADLSRLDELDRPAFLAVAARVGATRLIDNIHFDRDGGGFTVDRGVRLEQAGMLGGGG